MPGPAPRDPCVRAEGRAVAPHPPPGTVISPTRSSDRVSPSARVLRVLRGRGTRLPRPSTIALALLCVGAGITGLLAVPAHLPLAWDETVYASQYAVRAPAADFSAPRSRGMSLLTAPIVMITSDVRPLRVYLACTAVLAILLALQPWRRLFPHPWVAPTAAACYATLWVTLFYLDTVMPNHYTAMAALAATGWFLVAARSAAPSPERGRALRAMAVALGVVGLMRVSDAFWVCLPLGTLALLVRAWRRWDLLAAGAAGFALGAVPWAVEAQTRFGGVAERLREASEIQGGTGLTFSLRLAASTLDGPLLCRPCVNQQIDWVSTAWWLALAPLVVLGLVVATRRGVPGTAWVPCAVAACAAAPYLLLIGYSAPRFLQPTYALLSIPAALALVTVTSWARGALRGGGRAAVAATAWLSVLLLAGTAHLVVQGGILRDLSGSRIQHRLDYVRLTEALRREGVRPPCLVAGEQAVPIAYEARCASWAGVPRPGSPAERQLILRMRDQPAVFVTLSRRARLPWTRQWREIVVPGAQAPQGWRVRIAPWTTPPPR